MSVTLMFPTEDEVAEARRLWRERSLPPDMEKALGPLLVNLAEDAFALRRAIIDNKGRVSPEQAVTGHQLAESARVLALFLKTLSRRRLT